MSSDRKQKFKTQYLEQDATPCAVSDALHYLTTTCPFLRNFQVNEETCSPIGMQWPLTPIPCWGLQSVVLHRHGPIRHDALVPLAVLAVGELTVQGTVSAFYWKDRGKKKHKSYDPVSSSTYRSLGLQNIAWRSQLHSVGNIATPAMQWQIILHHNVIGFHSNALQWMYPIYKSHVSLKTKQLNAEDQHHSETCQFSEALCVPTTNSVVPKA